MIKPLLTLLLTVTTYMLSAQTTTLHGRVLDSQDSTALAGTTIVVEGGEFNTMCDDRGYFTLTNVPRSSTQMQLVMLGYATATVTFTASGAKTDLGTIFMNEEQNQIDAVVVSGEASMSIQRGDTTQFNASAFKTNPDADADELLMKMPGVVIQSGKIEAQGEPIRKIYVDGKLFFGSDPMAALKNLPADAIESIQLFDEPSEQARATGFEDGETQKAINIVTKSKAKESTIVKLESSAGADIDDLSQMRYLTGGNFSRFTEKDRLTLTALANNVNTMKFGQSEIAGNDRVDSNGNIVGQPAGIQTITGLGGNYSRDVEKMRFSGSYFFDHSDNQTHRYGFTNYYANPPKFDSKSVDSYNYSTNKSYNHRMNFRLELKPNDKNTFILSPNVSVQQSDYSSSARSLTMQNGDSLNRVAGYSPGDNLNYSISGEALYVRRFEKRGRNLSLGVTYSVSDRGTERYQKDTLRENYNNRDDIWEPIPQNKLNNRFIDQSVTGNTVKMRLAYTEPFAKYHRLQLSYILSRDWGGTNKQNSRLNLDTGEYTNIDSAQCSRFERDYNTMGAGLGYALYRKNIVLNMGLDYRRLAQIRDEFQPKRVETKYTFFDYQPSMSFKYTIQKSRYVRVNYRGRTELPRIEQMQNVVDDSSPSNLRIGNPDLKEGYRHSLTAFYNGTNIKKSTNLTLTLSAATISNFIASSIESLPADRDTTIYLTEQDRINQTNGYEVKVRGAFVNRYLNLDGYINTRASATYSFAIKSIKSNMNISADYNYIRTPSVYTTLNYANIQSGGVRIGLTSNISQNVDFNFYSSTAFNATNNTSKANSSYINQNIYLSTNIIFWKNFVFNSLFTWRYYNSSIASQGSSSYYLWNVGLGKKVFRRNNGEFRITAYDLLNQNKNLTHYVRNNAIEDVRTNTIGRYILARFSYRFNSMTNGRSKNKIDKEGVETMSVKEFKKKEGIKGGK